jgi:glycosyltransferase involved in cell wall biosynthesis
MRIMLVSFRYGDDISGGAERYLWELMTRLAGRGHHAEVFTTRSLQMIRSPFGYMLWDNFFPEGRKEESGVVVNRYTVRNPNPRRARRLWDRLDEFRAGEMARPQFASFLAATLSGVEEHCFLSGWHTGEQWNDGAARWSRKEGRLAIGGKGITGLRLEMSAPADGRAVIEIPGVTSEAHEMQKGRQRAIEISFPGRDSLAVSIRAPRTVRPPEDKRNLGLLLRRVSVADATGSARELDLGRGWTEFVESAPEEPLGKALWWLAKAMPLKASEHHKYMMGPNSPSLEAAVRERAADFDIILGSMSPMTTLSMASGAAALASRPYVAFPLFHSRDPNHFQTHLYQAMMNAVAVEANLPGIARLMEGWGIGAFAIGPGFDLREQESKDISGRRFREEFGFGDAPLLLWVARKNSGKGYRQAIEATRYLRSKGMAAELAMIGPDEDHLPVSGEGVHYLGSLPRSIILDAYDACDVFIFPSLHESFCLVFCEAWLRGKPVLGNVHCAAARDQINDGVDGYLCAGAREYAEKAERLLRDPGLAHEMGERGKRKIMETRGWDRIIDQVEARLERAVDSYAGTNAEAPGV